MRTFVVHFLRNDWQAYLDFLEECRYNKDWFFGYNNLNFDDQIVEYLFKHLARFRQLNDPDEISRLIKEYANWVINARNNNEFLEFPEFRRTFKSHDIFRQNHWDNAAKSSSLKWIQYSMNWPCVEEMPHHHTQPILDWQTLEETIHYCENDVRSTHAIYLHEDDKGEKDMLAQMTLRKDLTALYGVNLYSASETRISTEVFLYFLAEAMGREKRAIKDMRTERAEVVVRDLMLPVSFYTPEFQAMQIWFEQLRIDTSTGTDAAEKSAKGPKLGFSVKGMPIVWALGGIHGCVKPGIYRSGNGQTLMSADVTSYYPMLAIQNDWHPAHIPQPIFKKTYQGFFDKRKEYPKGHFLNYLFKIILNATYGLSKNKYSFLYDPRFTFQITVNGQLLLSKLLEMVLEGIPGARPIMANTDGFEVLIDDEYKDAYYAICREWEAMTQLSLEFVEYESMVIRDVNNYISTWTEKGKLKTKCKGAFEYENLPLHKNRSFLVIPKALYAYFVQGISPEDFLNRHATSENFYDFCAGSKLKGAWNFEEVIVSNQVPDELQGFSEAQQTAYLKSHGWLQAKDGTWALGSGIDSEERGGFATDFVFQMATSTGKITRVKHQKLLRYYISKEGNKIVKRDLVRLPDGTQTNGKRQIQLEAGKWKQVTCNQYVAKPFEDYKIDLRYYLEAIRNEISKIESHAAAVVLNTKAAQLQLW